jgi:hypothetical protein
MATAVVLLAVVTVGPASPSSSGPSTRANEDYRTVPAKSAGHPKLDGRLAPLARAAALEGDARAGQSARAGGLVVRTGKVQVVVEARPGSVGAARGAVLDAGGTIEAEYQHLIQALVAPSAFERLAGAGAVAFVRAPALAVPDVVPGQGVQSTGADDWHMDGITGAGVKVAVIDAGFAGYTQRQAEGDLPANLTLQSFCAGGINQTEHGTAVAEIVYEMAPGAQLFLICFETEVNLAQAEAYAKAQGIKVINHSVSWFNSSRGDGSGGPGTPDAIVADARANGILWVNSAGNHAQEHWSGPFMDTDGDVFHNWAPGDEGNDFLLPGGAIMCAALKWDDWPASDQDFDLYLGQGGTIIAGSEGVQNGTQPPTELICAQNAGAAPADLDVVIARFSATQTPRMDLFVLLVQDLAYQVAAGSLAEPASSPMSMSAGAICFLNNAFEFYSSQGPNIAGVTRPDIVAPDSVSSATYGPFSVCGDSGFAGSSASAAHTSGAAALVAQQNPTFGPAELQGFLEQNAMDLGAAGKDNMFGAGRLLLPAPGGPPPPPLLCPGLEDVPGIHRRGTGGPDNIVGTGANEVFCTFGGDDYVTAAGGNDLIVLGGGDDEALGGRGQDLAFGGRGEDELNGGPGDDDLVGGPGFDDMNGGPGNDDCFPGPGGAAQKSC